MMKLKQIPGKYTFNLQPRNLEIICLLKCGIRKNYID